MDQEGVDNEGSEDEREKLTDSQLYLAIGVPILFNAAMVGILIAYVGALNARITSVEAQMLNLENTFTTRFDLLMGRLTDLENEFHKR